MLEPGGELTGRVLDADGVPLGHAMVYVVGGSEPGPARVEDEGRVLGRPFPVLNAAHWTMADDEGRYTFSGVPARSVSVVARGPGTYHAYTAPLDVPEGGAVEAPDLTLRPVEDANRIRDTVLERDVPVARAPVAAYENRGPRNVDPRTRVLTDAEGRFELTVFADSVHSLQVTHSDRNGRTLVEDVHRRPCRPRRGPPPPGAPRPRYR